MKVLLGGGSYLSGMTRRTTRENGRRLYADPVLRPAPDIRRLVDLVLHLADAQHHAATRPHTDGLAGVTGTPIENETATSLANGSEPKEH